MTDKLDLYVPLGSQHKGELSIEGNARIDGEFIGSLYCEGSLTIGSKGRIEGEVQCMVAHISGVFIGCLLTHTHCTLFKTAHFEGSLDTALLTIQEGCKIKGEIITKGAQP